MNSKKFNKYEETTLSKLGLEKQITVRFFKNNNNEYASYFKNSDDTYTLMITNNITNVTIEKTFNDFDKMIENNSFKKLSKNNNIKEW